MTLPNNSDKFDSKAVISASEFIEKLLPNLKVNSLPRTVVLCFQQNIIDYISKKYNTNRIAFPHGELLIIQNENIGFFRNYGAGAPNVSITIELLYELGIENLLLIGTAGSISPNYNVGDIVICEKALRDEGTSYHYISSGKIFTATEKSLSEIKQIFERDNIQFKSGFTWTTDAPFRETEKEILEYQKDGIACVEMEISCVYAISKYLNYSTVAIVVISDSLAQLKWEPHFNEPIIFNNLKNILTSIIKSYP